MCNDCMGGDSHDDSFITCKKPKVAFTFLPWKFSK